jgi:hypothetical protein
MRQIRPKEAICRRSPRLPEYRAPGKDDRRCHGPLGLGTLFDEDLLWEQGLVWKYREMGKHLI